MDAPGVSWSRGGPSPVVVGARRTRYRSVPRGVRAPRRGPRSGNRTVSGPVVRQPGRVRPARGAPGLMKKSPSSRPNCTKLISCPAHRSPRAAFSHQLTPLWSVIPSSSSASPGAGRRVRRLIRGTRRAAPWGGESRRGPGLSRRRSKRRSPVGLATDSWCDALDDGPCLLRDVDHRANASQITIPTLPLGQAPGRGQVREAGVASARLTEWRWSLPWGSLPCG